MPYDIILGFCVGLSVLFFLLGRRFADAPATVEDQFGRYLADEPDSMLRPVVGDSISRLGFAQRVVFPLWRGALTRLGNLSFQRNVETLTKRLETAGRPYGLTVLNFLGLKYVVALVSLMLGFLLGVVVLKRPLLIGALFTAAFAVIGFLVPDFWLGAVIASRRRDIVRALPDALDMIVVCVEAGQSFDQALKRVSARWYNSLTEEFNRILTEIALGRTRREALDSASDRIGLPDMANLISAVIQADQLGVSIGDVLRVQANQLRTLRRQRAEELAREASIKLLFPLVFLIFPSMFAVLLGPAIPMIIETFLSVR
jgi:tight adherence protein C